MEKKKIEYRRCQDCGVLYPIGEDHECNILILHGYQNGKIETTRELVLDMLKFVCREAKKFGYEDYILNKGDQNDGSGMG